MGANEHKMVGLVGALATAAFAVRVQVAHGQTLEVPRARQGYYVSAGVLSGASRTWEDGESLGTWRGSAFNLRMGQLLTPRLGLGLQIALGNAAENQQHAMTVGIGLESHFELVRNLAAHASVGLGVLQLLDDGQRADGLRGTVGAEYMLGLSYAWYPFRGRTSGGLGVTPVAQTRFIPGTSAAGISFLFGVEIAWWTGLPRHQLQLPESEAYGKE
jgi:hypothetical protein